MKCASCQHEFGPDDKFCSECGAPLPPSCDSCGSPLRPGAKFCAACGTKVGASSPPDARPGHPATDPASVPLGESDTQLDGERKDVTTVFADIKGSMELIETLDPEDARAIVDPALKLMMDAVHHFGGYVAQSTGDGIFALFGAPVAHEDHPQRALYAALRMHEDLNRYSDRIRAEGGMPVQVRVGVNTGAVVVRSIHTGDAKTEYVPIGHSTSLAARMQALAPIGSIATTEAVRRLCEGYFLFKDLGPTRIKGVTEPINVFEVTGLGPLRTRLQRSMGRGLTKFVGRQAEMQTLKGASALVREGHGQIVAAMAEPGTGKSRLFFEFKAVSHTGWMVLEATSVSHGKASPYMPLIDLLHGYFDIGPSDDGRRRREKIAGRIAILDRALEDALPYLFCLLGIVEADDALSEMSDDVGERRIFDAVKRILLRESLNQPLMVIFEDLHWIDDHTQRFLNVLADSIGTTQLLLMVNYRPEYSHQWNSKTYYTQVRLDPLGIANAEEMLAALLGAGDDLVPLKRLIVDKTEGTPFFMEEIVQALFDDGTLVRNGAVQLVRPLSGLEIPTTVQAILATRIDRLPANAKELLQVLAVIGREFSRSLIRVLVDKPEEELDRLLTDLQLGEFIYEQPAVGDVEYIFKHALTQEVAYHSVLTGRRKALHERIGSTLESLYTDSIEDHLAELAHHYGRSDNPDAAVRYQTDAAKQKMDEARRVDGELSDILTADTIRGLSIPSDHVVPTTDRSATSKPAIATEPSAALGEVVSLWRYPVKSMAGENIAAAEITARGILGDRVYALVEQSSNRAAGLRTWASEILAYRPQFEREPVLEAPAPPMRINLPAGGTLRTVEPDLDARLSATLGRDVTLMATAPAGLLVEVPAGTLAGTMSKVTAVELGAGAPPGAFFDISCVHLIATATIEHLQKAYPAGRFDLRRFRPNIVVESQAEPFIEDSWVGRRLAIGDEVELEITMPCPRCSTVTLAQADLPRDARILRTIAENNMHDFGELGSLPCLGVYATVLKPGKIGRGDAVRCLE